MEAIQFFTTITSTGGGMAGGRGDPGDANGRSMEVQVAVEIIMVDQHKQVEQEIHPQPVSPSQGTNGGPASPGVISNNLFRRRRRWS